MFNGLNAFNTFPAYRQAGLLSSLKSKINLGAILTNTQKTLNIVNQAIPLVYQVKPMVENAKTIFKVMGAVKEDDTSSTRSKNTRKTSNRVSNNTQTKTSTSTIETSNTNNQPVFFI